MSRSHQRSYCPVGKRHCLGCSRSDTNAYKLAKAVTVASWNSYFEESWGECYDPNDELDFCTCGRLLMGV